KKGRQKITKELILNILKAKLNTKTAKPSNYQGQRKVFIRERVAYDRLAHNLKEDCQTLAKFFDDTTELKNAQKDLINFNNREEFERNKQNLLTKTNQAINGLSVRTGSSTYIGGVCDFRKEIESLKRDIENAQYEEAQELALIEQKEGELKQEIEENQRKAAKKKKQLKISNLGDNFNPNKHIEDFIKAIEDSLSGGNTPKNNPFQTPNINSPSGNSNPRTGGRTRNPLNPFQQTQNTSQD
ncbi:8990_t:CDS:2, partial [Funneliformis geosporum]